MPVWVGPGSPPGLADRTMQFGELEYRYEVFVPSTYDARNPMPALLLVHGGGGNGPGFIQTWTAFAESHGIILVAPTLDLSAATEPSVPILFPQLMNVVTQEWNVDANRRYLFGYSAGGYFVYDAALLRSDYFAGAGVFSAVIQPEYDSIVRKSPKRTDIAIYIGDSDPFFNVQQTRRTRDLLQAAGMDVHYVELPNQGHDYPSIAGTINADVWRFLSGHTLPR